jgi:hypothetical protein
MYTLTNKVKYGFNKHKNNEISEKQHFFLGPTNLLYIVMQQFF